MNRRKVAIIGAGIGGLTLAYAFALDGRVDVTVFMHKDAKDVRNGRIPSTQGHFERFLLTENRFQIPDYGPVNEIRKIELLLNGQKMFKGNLAGRAVSMDQRLYLSALIDGLHARGIQTMKRRLSVEELRELAEQFDVVIDCTGKVGPLAPFPIYSELSNTPAAPLRVCSAGMFHGIVTEEDKMSYNIVPELGELFIMPTMSKHGLVRNLLLEAVPGSELDRIKGDKGPEAFTKGVLEVLEAYFPHILDQVDRNEFRLADPLSYMRIAIKPEIRIPYTMIQNTLVVGCGDSVVLNDPITGQGANAASYFADLLYHVLAEHMDQPWDASIGELYWHRIKEYATKTSEWSNAMMGPMSESFAALMGRASQSQEAADALVNLFADPIQAHEAFFATAHRETVS